MVQFPARARDFSPLQSIQTGPGAHTALYSMGIKSSFNWNKAASVGSWPITSILWHVPRTEFNTYLLTHLLTYLLTYLLTPCSGALLEKLTGSQHFMEPEGSLPYSQVSATCPHSQPDQSSPCLHFLKMHFNNTLPPQAWVFQVITFPQVSPT